MPPIRLLVALACAAVAVCLIGSSASAAGPRLVRVGSFVQPVYVTAPRGDSRLFVVERRGVLRVVRGGRALRRPFADLRGQVLIRTPDLTVDQGGLLSAAFAPDYARSGLLYVFYTSRANTIRVDELRRAAGSPDRIDPGYRRNLITLPRTSRVDVGGQLQFGPDGMLYVGMGFGADPADAQDLGSLRGKILRIDPRPSAGSPYRVPADNPFVATPGALGEVWALGLRVPWRFSFDRLRGDLAIGDVGDDAFEEVDFAPRGRAAGSNFGYPLFEGRRRRHSGGSGLTFPVIAHAHGRRVCAVIGGYVVRDRALRTLYGRYLYGDLCSGPLRSVRLAPGRAIGDRLESSMFVPFLVSFGEDGRGHLYAVSLDGPVFRIA